ncbi:hypothetical protein HOLleu_06462 [Holothuria leucospilota]|uniref:Integrase catalytic domain-containing protein n=1 Tax=Holothuria leucospilota TaxID=206669 RepID=A0A9Q1HJK7_HOLLE|nr:hypothetical protein HOLleu_06462 [Holothuria leucospilota]
MEFKRFSKDWDFMHGTSSPKYLQGNGLAERSVQTIKTMLKKAAASKQDLYKCLLIYRSTPIDDLGASPAQLLMSRRVRTNSPVSEKLLHPESLSRRKVQDSLKKRQASKAKYYDAHTKPLPKLRIGESVRMNRDGN